MIVHPRYSRDLLANDVALLVLSKPITNVPRVQLAAPRQQLAPGEWLLASGFGATPTTYRSAALEYTFVPFLPRRSCQARTLAALGAIPPSHLCAGGLASGADTCPGDSGGPLVVDRAARDLQVRCVCVCGRGGTSSAWRRERPHSPPPPPAHTPSHAQVGIVSYGADAKCGRSGSIGFYTSVAAMRPWINAQLKRFKLGAN